MLLSGIVLGLIVGLAAGGRFDNLLAVRLRWTLLLFLAVALRLGTEAALQRNVALADQFRMPLLALAYGILIVALWVNRTRPIAGHGSALPRRPRLPRAKSKSRPQNSWPAAPTTSSTW